MTLVEIHGWWDAESVLTYDGVWMRHTAGRDQESCERSGVQSPECHR